MNFLSDKRRRRIFIITASVVTALAIIAITCAVYLGDYYRADNEAIGAFMPQGSNWKEEPDGTIVFEPEGAAKGFIFYPGGKVEYTAYAPLMYRLAQNGIACIITEMHFNLAVMDIDAADKAVERIADAEKWYVGGHSLGGSMAASWLEKTDRNIDGLILLASYSTADLSDNNVDVLSVYGSEDKVLNMEKYSEYFSNLPDDTTEIVIDGGNHAQFGCYGKQDGDGEAAISDIEQQDITAGAIAEFMGIENK